MGASASTGRPPSDSQAAVQAAYAAQAQHHLPQARALAEKALDLAQSDEEKATAWNELFILSLWEKQYDDALAYLDNILALSDITALRKADTVRERGMVFAAQHLYPAARAEYARCLTMPGLDTALRLSAQNNIGMTYLSEKNYPQARAEFEKALALPGLTPLWKAGDIRLIGETYDREGSYAQARVVYQQILGMPNLPDSERVQAQLLAALTFWHEKRLPEARQAYLDALQMPGIDDDQRKVAQRMVKRVDTAAQSDAAAQGEAVSAP